MGKALVNEECLLFGGSKVDRSSAEIRDMRPDLYITAHLEDTPNIPRTTGAAKLLSHLTRNKKKWQGTI